MIEIRGNLWDYYDKKNYLLVVTTNGFVKNNGDAVLGAGIAKQVKRRFPSLPRQLGHVIQEKGNHTHYFDELGIITLPVKHNWYENADIELIERSMWELVPLYTHTILPHVQSIGMPDKVVMPRPGTGNGKLDWADVRPVIEPYLDELGDRIAIVDWSVPRG